MRHFISRRDPQTLFYFISSIFLIAVAAVLAKSDKINSDKINYDHYYFNTTEGDIYKFSLITYDSSDYIANCTLSALVSNFQSLVVEKVDSDICNATRISFFFDNYTFSKGFMKFDITDNFRSCMYSTKKSGFFTKLSIDLVKRDIGFENCMMIMFQKAYQDSERAMSDQMNMVSGIIIGSLIFALCFPVCVYFIVRLDDNYKLYTGEIRLKSDIKINEISDQPLINSVASRGYDEVNDGENDDTEDDNDSNDTIAARPLIS